MDVYMGLDLGDYDHITPTVEQTRELHQIGFTTHLGENGWHARFEAGSYRVQIAACGRGWRITNTRVRDGRVEVVHFQADLTAAINLGEDMAFDIDMVDALTGLIASEIAAELRGAA